MVLERSPSNASVIDVLDHVLDKGIVIDAWMRVSLVGIDLLTIEARVIVASIESYLNYAGPLADVDTRPASLSRMLATPATSPRTDKVNALRNNTNIERTTSA